MKIKHLPSLEGKQILFYSHRKRFCALPSDNITIIEAIYHCHSTLFIPGTYLGLIYLQQ